MSIVLAADAERMSALVMGVLLIVSVATVGGAAFAGTFRDRLPETLRRLFGERPMMGLVFNAGAALMVLVAAQLILIAVLVARNGGKMIEQDELTAGSNLVLTAVSTHGVAFVAMLVGLAFFVRDGFDLVGLKRSPIMGGLIGAGLMVAAVPALLLLMGVTEWFYYFIDFKHEPAHQLLQAMDPDSHWVQIGAVFAAVVIAPLSEELFFRGHVQTLLRRWIARLFVGRAVLPMAATVDPSQQPLHVPDYGLTPPLAPPLATAIHTLPIGYGTPDAGIGARAFWPSCLAILATSLFFAWMHPGWTRPPIFVLSIALGFAYERTSNLWVPITMHAVFNGLMTTMYLLQTPQGT